MWRICSNPFGRRRQIFGAGLTPLPALLMTRRKCRLRDRGAAQAPWFCPRIPRSAKVL
jgi:hypothetical protein